MLWYPDNRGSCTHSDLFFHLQSYSEDWHKNELLFLLPVPVKLLSHVWLFAIPWTVAYQAPPSMEFSRQEYWVAISSSRGSSWPRDLTQVSHIAGRRFTIWTTREAPHFSSYFEIIIWCPDIRRRQWHPTPVLLPGKSHEQRSLVYYSPWDRKESDMTERLHFHFQLNGILTKKKKKNPHRLQNDFPL